MKRVGFPNAFWMHTQAWACVAIGLALLALAPGCLSRMPPDPELAPEGPVEVPEAVRDVEAVAPRSADVRLRPGLSIGLAVLVGGKKEIDESAKRISEGGTIILPLLGEVAVMDSTLDELRLQLVEGYRKYFVDPQVIVDFAMDPGAGDISPWGFLTVLGRVMRPGRIAIPATRDLTVSGAIQKAGGFSTSAKQNAILVSRSMPDGSIKTFNVNLTAVGKAGRLEEDLILEANDVVFVPEAMF